MYWQKGDNSLLNNGLCIPRWLVNFLCWEALIRVLYYTGPQATRPDLVSCSSSTVAGRFTTFSPCFFFSSSLCPWRGSPKKFAIKSAGLSAAAWRSELRKRGSESLVWTHSPEPSPVCYSWECWLCSWGSGKIILCARTNELVLSGAWQKRAMSVGSSSTTLRPDEAYLVQQSKEKRGLDLVRARGGRGREGRRTASGWISSVFSIIDILGINPTAHRFGEGGAG